MAGSSSEDQVFRHRARLFQMLAGGWAHQGTGDIRLLASPAALRVVMREASSGAVLLNVNVGPHFRIAAAQSEADDRSRAFAFRVADSLYAVRFKGELAASEFAQKVETATALLSSRTPLTTAALLASPLLSPAPHRKLATIMETPSASSTPLTESSDVTALSSARLLGDAGGYAATSDIAAHAASRAPSVIVPSPQRATLVTDADAGLTATSSGSGLLYRVGSSSQSKLQMARLHDASVDIGGTSASPARSGDKVRALFVDGDATAARGAVVGTTGLGAGDGSSPAGSHRTTKRRSSGHGSSLTAASVEGSRTHDAVLPSGAFPPPAERRESILETRFPAETAIIATSPHSRSLQRSRSASIDRGALAVVEGTHPLRRASFSAASPQRVLGSTMHSPTAGVALSPARSSAAIDFALARAEAGRRRSSDKAQDRKGKQMQLSTPVIVAASAAVAVGLAALVVAARAREHNHTFSRELHLTGRQLASGARLLWKRVVGTGGGGSSGSSGISGGARIL